MHDNKILDMTDFPAGVRLESVESFCGFPDEEGILFKRIVKLPSFEVATYFAAYQRHDMVNASVDTWPECANRIQPLPIHDFNDLKRGGMFLLIKISESDYMALLPLAGEDAWSWFTSEGTELILNTGNMGTGSVSGNLPLLTIARADTPYAACTEVWQKAIDAGIGTMRQRCEKIYPEAFRYLGWCSWEEYRFDIHEQLLVDACKTLDQSAAPIRYVLIDDGHLDHNNQKLVSFNPNDNFPNGWNPVLAERRENSLRWFGLWLNFNGYWQGMNPQHQVAELQGHMIPAKGANAPLLAGDEDVMMMPGQDLSHAQIFYDTMIGTAADAGFDFVKVDNQASNLQKYWGTEQAVKGANACSRALEQACETKLDGLINCMAHNTVCAFNTSDSAVTRCSEDYLMGDLDRAKGHLHNSYANMAWFGHTVWGDHDMFHSNDQVSGQMMAVSKALSGGPVYLSDAPDAIQPERVLPLCFEDGELLRPLAPATALPESLFVDPFDQAVPFRGVAPLVNRCAAIAVYNLTIPEKPVTGTISVADYLDATMLMQPAEDWQVPDEGLVVYDWYNSAVTNLDDTMEYTLETFSDRLYLLCPISNGWSVIGRRDKYLSPAAVKTSSATDDTLSLELIESGPLLVWSTTGKPECAYDIQDLGNGLYEIALPLGQRDFELTLTRT